MATCVNNLGLSLSGRGYRTCAFHLGTMKKLYKLQILKKVNVMSTISGCSKIGVYQIFEGWKALKLKHTGTLTG